MKISIIVPVYNVPRPLFEASLASLARQSLRAHEYEIVLVDDCSTDPATLDALRNFVSKTPNARIIRHEENRGLNEARRTGVKAASGDYVIFVDGDDILSRDALEILRMEAHKNNADLVTAQSVRWLQDKKRYTHIQISSRALSPDFETRIQNVCSGRHTFTMCGRLFRRSILTDVVFDIPSRLYHEDLATFVRALYNVRTTAHVNHLIYYYTVNETSITGEFTLKHVEDMFWSLHDWAAQAERHGLLSRTNDAVPQGLAHLMNICTERCLSSTSLDPIGKARILTEIKKRCDAFPLPVKQTQKKYFGILQSMEMEQLASSPRQALNAFAPVAKQKKNPAHTTTDKFPAGIQPSDMARRLKGKIIFIGQVDYQLRNAATFANELTARGHQCVVLDNSSFASDGLRQLQPEEERIFELSDHIRVERPPYGPDYLSTAKLVITFNDFNYDFREALEYRDRLGLPSVCAVEGINDFLRLDFAKYRLLPYRRCDYVFLSGDDDEQFFKDRQTYVTGLPIIEKLSHKKPVFPEQPLAILNVNFTYGVLEQARDQFIRTAQRAFAEAGFDYLITKHPAERGDLTGLPVDSSSQYELIDAGTVFVSRFATGILEALASGKPAIYFNPHGEKVEKFKSPMGAFLCASTEAELADALKQTLQDIAGGVDFRERAAEFLRRHTAYAPQGKSTAERFADAVADIVERTQTDQETILNIFFERLGEARPDPRNARDIVFGDFSEDCGAWLDEAELLFMLSTGADKTMAYCGPAHCANIWAYLDRGWVVHASSSPENMSERVDFLNVDLSRGGGRLIEDKLAENWKPEVVLAASGGSEPASPKSIGETAKILLKKDYAIYLSAWRETSNAKSWIRLTRYAPGAEKACDTSNIIAFSKDPGAELLRQAAALCVKFQKTASSS